MSRDSDFDDWIGWRKFDGVRLVALMRAYFDESDKDNGGTFVIAGCLFTLPQAEAFVSDMLPLFEKYGGCHMTDLVSGWPPYDKLCRDERAALVRRAVEITIDRVELGVLITANIDDLENGPACAFALEKSYGICAEAAVSMMDDRLNELGYPYYEPQIEYLFEAGYSRPGHVKEFREYMTEFARVFWKRQKSIGFHPKKPCFPFDACDVVAWEIGNYVKNGEGETVRGSLGAFFKSGKFCWLKETRESLEATQDALRRDAEERKSRASQAP